MHRIWTESSERSEEPSEICSWSESHEK
jgi:hypothetical protein